MAGVVRILPRIGNVLEPKRRAVLVGNDQVFIVLFRPQLVVGIDGGRTLRPIQVALGLIDIGACNGLAQTCHRQAVRRKRLRIGLYAHSGPLPARNTDQPHACNLREFLRDPDIDQIPHLMQRQRGRRHRQADDSRVCWVYLVIDGRRGQVARQQVGSCVDRGLHLLLGDIQRQVQIELQGDERSAAGTR
jgi:hypothetical protein